MAQEEAAPEEEVEAVAEAEEPEPAPAPIVPPQARKQRVKAQPRPKSIAVEAPVHQQEAAPAPAPAAPAQGGKRVLDPNRPLPFFQQVSVKSDGGNPDDESSTYVPILSYKKHQARDGSYKSAFETGNNIQQEETGFLKERTEQAPNGTLVQQGSYSYTSPDGEVINVAYTADENGFHVESDSLPTPPPVSEEIQKGLDLIYEGIRKNKERAENDPEYAALLASQKNYNGFYVPS